MQPVAVSVVQEAQPSTYGVLSVVPLAPPPSEKQASVSTGAVFVEKRVVEEPAPVLMRGCPWKVRAVLHGERSSAVFGNHAFLEGPKSTCGENGAFGSMVALQG
jgi:hypothetical protein